MSVDGSGTDWRNRMAETTPTEDMFASKPKPFENASARRCLRVLRMVNFLHGKGLHGLRVQPTLHAGVRSIQVFPSRYLEPSGAQIDVYRPDKLPVLGMVATHVCGTSGAYFEWGTIRSASAHDLALRFIKAYPAIIEAAGYDLP